MTKKDHHRKLREKISSVMHRICTRSLRGAEIYLSHVNEVDKGIEDLVKSEVCQVLDRLKKESIEYATGDEMAELVYENLIPLSAIEAERKLYE